MSITLKPVSQSSLSDYPLWTRLAQELSAEAFWHLIETTGVPVGRETSSESSTSPVQAFVVKHTPENPPATKPLKHPSALLQPENWEERTILTFFEAGESKFPSEDPTFFIRQAIFARWEHVLETLFEEKTWPIQELEKIKVPFYLSNTYKKTILPLLHYITSQASPSFLDTYAAHGVNIEQTDKEGRTPIFFARNEKTLKVLLAHNAKSDVTDHSGNTPSVFWASRSIPVEELQAMQALVSQHATPLEEEVVSKLKQVKDFCNAYGSMPTAPDFKEDLELPWAELIKHRFEKNRKEGDYSLHALDLIGLHLLKHHTSLYTKEIKKNKAFEILVQDLVQGQDQFDLYAHQHLPHDGFIYFVALDRVFHASNPFHTSGPSYLSTNRALCVDAAFKHWIERWNPTSFGQRMHLMSQAAMHWEPFFRDINHLDFLEESIEKAWDTEPSEKWAALWNNDPAMGLSIEEHEAFWVNTLRHPILQKVWLTHGSHGKAPLLNASSNDKINAAQYAAWANYLYERQKSTAHSGRYRTMDEDIQARVTRWLDKGVEWKAEATDKKWFSKVNRLRESEIGARLSSVAQQGWFKQNIQEVDVPEVSDDTPQKPKHRL